MNDTVALDLIGQIYDASLNPDLWPELLCSVADACGMENAALVVIDPKTSFSSVLSPRTNPDVVLNYNRYWWQHDLTTEIAAKSPVGHFTTLADTGKDRFLDSAFYNEFWRYSGLGAERLAVNLLADGEAFSSLVIQSSASRDEIDSDAFETASILIPHLARSVAINRRIHHLELEQAGMLASHQSDHAGLILVDRDGHCIHADKTAEDMMRDGIVLKLDHSVVRLCDNRADMRLQTALRALARTGSASSSNTRPIPLNYVPGCPLLTLEVLPCQTNTENPSGRQAAAKLVFRDPRASRSAQVQRLRREFGLTPAEAALAIEMLEGDGRAAAANRCGITVNTARTHLTRIFEKTGVTRQAELIRVVLDSGQ